MTRQLRYSNDYAQLALDLGLFINGLPVATFELKNSLTKQTVEDAIEQYKRDRNPREKLFELGRCLAHFAVDDHEVKFCTHLKGKASWFLPLNKGWNDGKGNPPNPNGLKTDYLWKQVLTRDGLTNIIENYAQVVESKDDKTGRKKREQIWPRYHQLDVVRRLLADASTRGVGPRYLIQHSAGSGKSNSIAWLAHQLIGLEQDGGALFDSVIVVTDRRLLDKQIRDTIKQFTQVGSVVGHAESSGHLRTLLQEGKRIVITTVQKFPFILDAMGNEHRGRTFAIIIDEAHSSQGGRTSASVSMALGEAGSEEEDETTEDKINRLMEAKKMLPNASYFAFTATPKSKTLELFGTPVPEGGKTRHVPFHSYTMKQAIQEGFIIDVLAHYMPVDSYYRLVKTVEDDPEFDTKRAGKKLRRYVEDNDHAIRLKAELMVDNFHEQVAGLQKIGGQARAMVVTSSIQRAISYFYAIRDYLAERKSPYRAIAAFSGEHEHDGAKVTEASLNGFSSNLIADKIQEEPYRFLVCADKFQTGYDEPLLHTIYVDKILSGVKAVQTLSRLNRSHPKKHDAFVLDFANDADTIHDAFSDYYRTTVLAEETDPDRLHDLKAALDGYQVYAPAQVDEFVKLFLSKADRTRLDPILDGCVSLYREQMDEDGQVDFKGKAKAFLRTYGFLAAILPYANAEWEKLSIFLTFLVPKLPAPIEDDLSKGILEAIDMDSYRVEKQAVQDIQLPDEDAEIEPVSTSGGGQKPETEMERLSNIIREFNDRFGNIDWKDQDKIEKVIAEELPAKVAGDRAYQNAMANSDQQNARIEHDKALERAMTELLADHTGVSRHILWRFLERGHMGRSVPSAVLSTVGGSVRAIEEATFEIIIDLEGLRPDPALRHLRQGLEEALLLLCATPLATVEELARFGRVPTSTLRDRLRKLAERGLADSLEHHLSVLGSRPQRRYFPTEKGVTAAGAATKGRNYMLRAYPVSKQWFRLLAERLDAVAVLHRVAAMVADADPHDDPVRVDHYRNGPYDMLLTLSGGRTIGLIRQGPALPTSRLRYRLRSIERLESSETPFVTLVLTHADQTTRRAIRSLGDPSEHRRTFVATEGELLAGDHTGVVWQQCGSGVGEAVRIDADASLAGILALAERLLDSSYSFLRDRPKPNPSALYPSDMQASMPEPTEQLKPALPVQLTRAEKDVLDPLAAWPLCTREQLAGLMGSVTLRRVNQVLRSLTQQGLVRTDEPLHMLTDEGLTYLARRDRADGGLTLDRWSAEPLYLNADIYAGTAVRALASQMRHHAGVIDFTATLSAEVARSPAHDLFDLLPTSRSSIGYRYDWTTYVIHPDASFTLEYKGRWRPYLLEFERRATTPKRARSRLMSLLRPKTNIQGQGQ